MNAGLGSARLGASLSPLFGAATRVGCALAHRLAAVHPAMLAKDGGLRNSRTGSMLVRTNYAARPCQSKRRCGSTVLARNPVLRCASRAPLRGVKAAPNPALVCKKPARLALLNAFALCRFRL